MDSEKYKNYLCDLGTITKEYAREAISEHMAARGTDEEYYKTGYKIGFHRFVTLMQQQAEAFDIPLKDIGLDDIDENEFFK
ncbi:hypothetical protein TUM4438_44790 [Shewanella sairae]|uniref:Uncharacterized protein n=1 Tax=Shewanella sairae TaxID=190310 RepID=A0ABQ4PRL4_9GAMM|nr:hypothetical protein [Shewanella sairae]MCL1132687.1 hypothetical protein [Shewanella sairae]GIU52338.1 hypothetical protein TUM4438_44790 [Shewanella sairae]